MSLFQPNWSGVRRSFRLWGARAASSEVDDEVRFHLEERIEELIGNGLTRDEATRVACERFGDITRIETECRTIDRARTRRRVSAQWIARLVEDVRTALRRSGAQPLASAIIVATLALGIGANTAIFSAVNAVLLHPLPVAWLRDLVVLQGDLPGLNLHHTQVSPGEALDLFNRTDLFQSATAFSASDLNLSGAGEPRAIKAVVTLGDFFSVFGIRPYLGHFYRPEDSENGNDHVVVLSYATWQDVTGSDSSVIGRTLRLNDETYQVIGVLPPEFRYPRYGELWEPRSLLRNPPTPQHRQDLFLTAVARVRPGVTPSYLRTALQREAEAWHQRFGYPPSMGHQIVTQPLVDFLSGELRAMLIVLSGAAFAVLLIACANVASLQLVRGFRRSRELTIRTALGAARWQLFQQLLVESGVLAGVGGLAGLAVSLGVLTVVTPTDTARFAVGGGVHLDSTVLAFTALATAATALLFGVVPAISGTRVDPGTVLKAAASRTTTAGIERRSILRVVVVAQVALAVVLLFGSGLLIRSLTRLLTSDPGFSATDVMTAQVGLYGSRYPTPASRLAFQNALVERLHAMPGIQTVSTAWGLPFTNFGTSSSFDVVGQANSDATHERHANMWFVGGDYFKALGIHVLAGRVFNQTDGPSAPRVVVIDETLARQYFRGENPIGRQIDQVDTCMIIGVVASVKQRDLAAPDKAAVYYPMSQFGSHVNDVSVAIRGTLTASESIGLLRSAVRELDKDAPVFDVASMDQRVSNSLGDRRLAMRVVAGFATVALLLAVLGIYGVVSFVVSERRHEIGVRLALGATPADVMRQVIGDGLALVLIGLLLGTAAFLTCARFIEAVVYGVSVRDPATMLVGATTLVLAAFVANWLPAWHAGRIDPLEAVRCN